VAARDPGRGAAAAPGQGARKSAGSPVGGLGRAGDG